jgi:hypothetical protein
MRKSLFQSAFGDGVSDGSPLSTMNDLTSQLGGALGGDAQKYIQQGQQLFNGAQQASHGDYSGLVSAIGGIINDLPPSQFRAVVNDTIGIIGAAAKGEEIGSQFGAYGAIAGAAIGAVVEVIQDILSSPPPPPQGDTYRSSADQIIFPATPNAAPYSVIPGQSNVTPRGDADSIFYQLSTDKDWALQFAFGITWIRPLGATGGNQDAAWALAQWYVALDAVSQAHALNPANKPSQDLIVRAKQAELKAGQACGGPGPAKEALKLLESWYGKLGSWKTVIPFGQNWQASASQALKDAYGSLTSAWGGGGHNDGVTAGAPAIVMNEFLAKPLDYLYYPIPVKWNGSDLVAVPAGDVPTAIMMSADLWLCALAELAVGKAHDLVALHLMTGGAWLYASSQKIDLVANPQANQKPHENTMRIIGIISAKIKADPKRIAAMKAKGIHTSASKHLTLQGISGTLESGHVSHGKKSHLWLWLLGLVGAGGAIHYATKDK